MFSEIAITSSELASLLKVNNKVASHPAGKNSELNRECAANIRVLEVKTEAERSKVVVNIFKENLKDFLRGDSCCLGSHI